MNTPKSELKQIPNPKKESKGASRNQKGKGSPSIGRLLIRPATSQETQRIEHAIDRALAEWFRQAREPMEDSS
jgi:hypothetical protein